MNNFCLFTKRINYHKLTTLCMNPFLYISPIIRVHSITIIITPLIYNFICAHFANHAPTIYTVQLAKNQNGSKFIYFLFKSSAYSSFYLHRCSEDSRKRLQISQKYESLPLKHFLLSVSNMVLLSYHPSGKFFHRTQPTRNK